MMRSTLPPSVLPDISPTGGRLASPGFANRRRCRKRKRPADLPPVGEMSGRTEGGAKIAVRRSGFSASSLSSLLLVPASAAKVDNQFRAWLENDLWPDARSKGISRQTFDTAFAGVTPNLNLPDLVMPGEKAKTPKKQHQAEFGSPGNYFAEKTIGAVTAGGRSRAAKYAKTLAGIEKAYGVPGGVVLAIWGRESGFGSAKMPYDAFEVLGTKAFMSTRKDMFRKEVLAALEIVERGLASARSDEVVLGRRARPAAVPALVLPRACGRFRRRRPPRHLELGCRRHGLDRQLSGRLRLGQGPRLGFRGDRAGRRLLRAGRPGSGPAHFGLGGDGHCARQRQAVPGRTRRAPKAILLMPAGRNGPAFIVTPNFYVLKEYNESDLYALFIGHGADRIAHGDKNFAGKWGKVGGLYRSDIADAAARAGEARATMSAAPTACPASRRAARSATGRPGTAAPRRAFPIRSWCPRSNSWRVCHDRAF